VSELRAAIGFISQGQSWRSKVIAV